MAGLDSTGFIPKPLSETLAEIEAAEKAALGAGINTLATSVFGQINGIMAGQLNELWELGLAIYRAFYPDSASDDALEGVAAITGANRLAATNTTVPTHCTGTPTTVLNSGRIISTDIGDRLATTAAATISAATIWAINTAYAVGAIRSNNSNIYVCVTAGTSAGAGGPTTTGDGIADNTVVWNFVGDGLGFVIASFTAEETGPIPADAGAVHTDNGDGDIETPVAGWDDARNLTDGTAGRVIETDAAFRLRRELLLAASGAASLNAIRADIIGVAGVLEAFVFHNTTLVTDSDGIPGKAYESVFSATAVDAARKGGLASGNAETYAFVDGQTLTVSVDGAGAQTATFNIADFVGILVATAAEVVIVLNTDIAGATARVVTAQGQTYVYIESDTTGATSSIEITGGTEAVLGFPETPVVANGVDTAVAQAVFNSGAGGIEPHGTFKVRIVDDQGTEHLVGVTNPAEKVVEIQLTVTTDDDYAATGDADLKAALVALGDTLTIGQDVIYERMQAEVFTISGVTDVTLFQIRFTGDAWGVINLPVTGRQLATFDTSDVTII